MEARATGKRIFIGSSQEARKAVDGIARCLEGDGHTPKKWMSVFERPGQYNLEELTACAESVDGAIFVFTPDMQVARRNKTEWMPCPNVVLEFGLFLSRLGRKRSIQISVGDLGPISDLDGIVPLKIDPNRAKRGELDEDAQQRLKKWADELPNRQRNSVATIEMFPIERFKSALSKANVVRILQTFMPYDQHLALFKDELKTVANAGGTVHVLLCNPGSCACLIRGIALHRGYEKVREEIENNLNRLRDVYKGIRPEARGRFEVKVYSTMPSMAIYETDKEFICGNYFHQELAINGPQLLIDGHASAEFRKFVEKEHERIWNHGCSKKVDMNDLEGWFRKIEREDPLCARKRE